jgi:hypothetical protein
VLPIFVATRNFLFIWRMFFKFLKFFYWGGPYEYWIFEMRFQIKALFFLFNKLKNVHYWSIRLFLFFSSYLHLESDIFIMSSGIYSSKDYSIWFNDSNRATIWAYCIFHFLYRCFPSTVEVCALMSAATRNVAFYCIKMYFFFHNKVVDLHNSSSCSFKRNVNVI